jgi:predicted MPP superfamily phosphohydrolase
MVISGSGKRFKAGVQDLTDLGQESKGLASLPNILRSIDIEVQAFMVLSKEEKESNLTALKQQLAKLQDAVEEAIAPWIDVNSVGATWVKEKLGIPSTVNYQLLMFMSVLSELCKPEHMKSLFLITITLEKDGKSPRVIVLK